jgi:carboxyl-terminal processing protease
MTQCLFRVKSAAITLIALVGLLLPSVPLTAEPVPGKQDRLVVQMVCELLHRAHLTRPEISDDLSRRLFQRFIKDLDPSKGYFLKSDIEEFKKFETELDDMIQEGDLGFAYKVYGRLVTRIGERLKLIEELIKAPQDFTVKEFLDTDFDKIDYAKDENDLRERWRKRIKFDLLLHRLGSKPVSDAEARQKVQARYRSLLKRWQQLDNYELMELFLSDLTASIDPHSSYMAPPTLDDFDIAMRLHLEGIGALLRSENGQTIVAEVLPGGPAATDGRLKPNDKIIGVAQGDGRFVDVVDMKLRDVVKLIRGNRGTQVQLRVMPAEKIEPVVYPYTRQNIELKDQEARSEVVDFGKKPDGKPYRIGVIDLPSFYVDTAAARSGRGDYKSATEDVRKILQGFKAQGVDGVILDLRRNGGGALSEAVALTGLFIDQGPVVQVKDYRGRVERKDDPEPGTVYKGPLMVLESRLSASASEILAGALQDYDRALIVGDSSTHGKGTVQMLIDLGDQLRVEPPPKLGALKLTVQQFYRVNGDSTQDRGVIPDVVIPSITEELSTGEKELEHALAFDRVPPVAHEDLGKVPAGLKTALRARSAARVKASPDFGKLLKEAEQLKERRQRKTIPLNERELRDIFGKEDAEKAEQKVNGVLAPEPPPDNGPYKFPRNFATDEVLHVMEDLLQAKAAPSR